MDLKKLLSGAKDKKLLIFIGLLGILLLLAGQMGGGSGIPDSGLPKAEEYKAELETSLSALCEQVAGGGRAQVFVTLSGTEAAVYEKNDTASGETLATAGGGALLLYYEMPRVMGVAVVCDGGDSLTVKRELTSLLCASLAVDSHRVYVTAAK